MSSSPSPHLTRKPFTAVFEDSGIAEDKQIRQNVVSADVFIAVHSLAKMKSVSAETLLLLVSVSLLLLCNVLSFYIRSASCIMAIVYT